MTELDARIAPNWTSAAGALEGILAHLGAPLPRHAIMGLTGHAWHLCLGSKEGVVALPSGPTDLDWESACARYARTGFLWERFGGDLNPGDYWTDLREAAAAWASEHLATGRPLIGWDFHLHEHAVIYGYDGQRRGFLVDDVLTGEAGPFVALDDWPSVALGRIELLAPVEAVESDPIESVAGALETAILCIEGGDGLADAQPRGAAALDAWADALDGETEVDRAGNAYTLAVLQTARLDGAAFLEDIAAGIPELAATLGRVAEAVRAETTALSPLITLVPFPSGGHGNITNAGLRRAAAMALRRAAKHERDAAEAMREALRLLEA